ncbi:MAG: type II secretion system F family protein [Planctomycetota bacterium]|jgi:type II secretory pathway component PulF
MTAYACKTRDSQGEVVEKDIEAITIRDAISQLEENGLFPIRIDAIGEEPEAVEGVSEDLTSPNGLAAAAAEPPPKVRTKGGRIKRKDLMQFSVQLSGSLDAGMTILGGVRSCIKLSRNAAFNKVLETICTDIESGAPLSEAMGRHPKVFPHAYVGTIGAGERSGSLEEMLDNLAEFLEADMEVRSDIRSAIMYPLIVVVTLCIAIVVLIAFVVPRFTAFYDGFDAELPLATRMLISFSGLMEEHYLLLMAGVAGTIFAIKRTLKVPLVRAKCDRLSLRIPVFGPMVETALTLEAVQLLGLFTKAGVPILEALHSAARTTNNTKYRNDLESVATGISGGQTLAAGMEAADCFPLEARLMLSNGESTGTIERACQSTARRYKKELRFKTKMLATMIEPMLTLVLAGVVLFIALAIFMPMWDLVSVVG